MQRKLQQCARELSDAVKESEVRFVVFTRLREHGNPRNCRVYTTTGCNQLKDFQCSYFFDNSYNYIRMTFV